MPLAPALVSGNKVIAKKRPADGAGLVHLLDGCTRTLDLDFRIRVLVILGIGFWFSRKRTVASIAIQRCVSVALKKIDHSWIRL